MEQRVHILVKTLSDIEHDLSEDDFTEIATQCHQWSGSDLYTLCREASMAPIREFTNQITYSTKASINMMATLRPVTKTDFNPMYAEMAAVRNRDT